MIIYSGPSGQCHNSSLMLRPLLYQLLSPQLSTRVISHAKDQLPFRLLALFFSKAHLIATNPIFGVVSHSNCSIFPETFTTPAKQVWNIPWIASIGHFRLPGQFNCGIPIPVCTGELSLTCDVDLGISEWYRSFCLCDSVRNRS
jgi:hypothetical protein